MSDFGEARRLLEEQVAAEQAKAAAAVAARAKSTPADASGGPVDGNVSHPVVQDRAADDNGADQVQERTRADAELDRRLAEYGRGDTDSDSLTDSGPPPPTYQPDPAVYEPAPLPDALPKRRLLGRRGAASPGPGPRPVQPPAEAPSIPQPSLRVPAEPVPAQDHAAAAPVALPPPAQPSRTQRAATVPPAVSDDDDDGDPPEYSWQRTEAVDLDLHGAPTWDPDAYVDQPVEEEPVGDQPVADESRVDEPAADGPVADHPGAESPTSDEAPAPAPRAAPKLGLGRLFARGSKPSEAEPEPAAQPEPGAEAEPSSVAPAVAASAAIEPRPAARSPRPSLATRLLSRIPLPAKPIANAVPATTSVDPSAPPEPAPSVGAQVADRPRPRPRPVASAEPTATSRPRPRPRPATPHVSSVAEPAAVNLARPSDDDSLPPPDISRFLDVPEPEPDAKKKEKKDQKEKQEKKEKKEKQEKKESAPSRSLRGVIRGSRLARAGVRIAIVVVVAVVVALVLRAYVVAPYYIPSASMEPTLIGCNGCTDDHVLVDKFSYHFHNPHQSDIVVFNRPKNLHVNEKVLIKRVIAIPGDRVALKQGLVYVNGKRLKERYINKTCGAHPSQPETKKSTWTIPRNDYFVMGDNRCDSTDSRTFGPIPKSSIVGRAFAIIWPIHRIGSI